MKKRKLKKFVMPSIYTLSVIAIIISGVFLARSLGSFLTPKEDLKYVLNPVEEETITVMEVQNTTILKPFDSENVAVSKKYYSKDAEAADQQQSLIYYQKTYMQNTGVLYNAPEQFNVIAPLDGKVINIKQDDILGNIVEVEHNSKLITVYECLGDVQVAVNDEIKQGDIIGTSGSNKLDSNNENALLFEVHLNGLTINPETFYTMTVEELQ